MKQSRKVQKSLQSCRHGGKSTDDVQTKRAKGSWYTHQCVCVCVWCGGGAGRSGHHLELLQDHVVHGKVSGLAESSAAKVLLIRVPQALDQVVLCAEWVSEFFGGQKNGIAEGGRIPVGSFSLSIYLVLFLRACHSPGFQSKSLMAFWMSVKKCWSLIGKAFLPPKSKSAASK